MLQEIAINYSKNYFIKNKFYFQLRIIFYEKILGANGEDVAYKALPSEPTNGEKKEAKGDEAQVSNELFSFLML